ncbi:UbiX family flavin prenyltransferase [Ligilactobacillus pobuzihii]|uniref:Flavin prenyltransferase UbiX n=1 Tax=Ligilactobacillus pobuzihii TaxID=449659 RepID=A0A0R2LLL1_9LACO|nr:UbiX family flavin prenyltransferase [Ligilactobacillus pobuzihii]KRK11020.1 3-octaprenyl-4-hydroxybenzoate carboxy-lyase [Ligilactobacillus pobuzihii E100301 = KCTC 13174]KRN99565.1 3-octaprenyl-4-hydroxybenzoate carboxy-lyase [Ligilactobacillus pobuzihii]GEN48338.1 flavin prenyltransferase UbiX [Ligilactobacillus pobuzihii]
MKKIIIGVSGASGTIYAVDLLKKTQQLSNVETHLVMSKWAKQNLALETNYQLNEINSLADYVYDERDQAAKIASGSFLVDGMVVVPASMKTIAGIANGFADNLVGRAADVILKEQRKLVIVPRESPLSVIHLENLTKLAKIGAQIIPPIPAFYNHPSSIQDLVDHQTMKTLDALGINNDISSRWDGR